MSGLSCSRLLFCLALLSASAQQNPGPPAVSAPEPAKTTVTVSVTDHNHHLVTGLKAEDFTLYEEGQPQPISAVTPADVPACIGILVDQSGSMRGKHADIASAIRGFLAGGNPENQAFVVLFNDDPMLEQDFTRNADLIERSIAHANARGGTAMYDSIIASADHLNERPCGKRVLLIVGDGEDNESRKTLENTVQALQQAGNPLLYAIALPHPNPHNQRAFETLSARSGGMTLFAGNSGELRKAALKIAEELRNQYSITYASAKVGNPQIKVAAHAADRKDLLVRVNAAGVPDVISPPVARTVSASPTATERAVSQPAVAASQQQPGAARGPDCISGTVLDEDQKPVARIHVEAMPAFGPNPYSGKTAPYSVTDAKGHFRLAELVKGNYRLHMRPETYSRGEGVVYRNEDRTPVASSESCSNVTLKFLTRFATLKVHLIDAVSRQPIPDYGVLLRNDLGEAYSISRIDQEAGIRVPPGIELTIQAWILQPHLRSEPMTLTTPAADNSREITLELDQRSSTGANNP